MQFYSDNTGPAHPKVMEALLKANEGYASSYGDDALMDEVRAKTRDVFEAPEAAVYLVATGTAANALSLATLAVPLVHMPVGGPSAVAEDGRWEPFDRAAISRLVADGKTVELRVDDVLDLAPASKSLMPEALLQALTAQQAADLIAYLGSLRGSVGKSD